MENKAEKKGLNISTKCFINAILVILALMILTYILTYLIPAGSFQRTTDAAGHTVIAPDAVFTYSAGGGLPFWKWLLSPVLVLGAEGGGTILAVIVFLLVIGGVFNSLERCGLMKYMLDRVVHRFGRTRYQLLAAVTFFFMAMGAFLGSFEECVPLVPIVVALAVGLGWDVLTGLGMSLLAVGFGFSSGVCNPFTVGVAQGLAGLPMFSGVWLRAVGLVLIYGLLLAFLIAHAKKVARSEAEAERLRGEFRQDAKMDSGLRCFAAILGCGILLVLCSGFITALQSYTMIIVAVMFLAAGISSTLLSGMKGKDLGRTFRDGVVSILPGVLMILMASSIKYTLTEGRILDTILLFGVQTASTMPRWLVILFIYLIVLVMNFFIGSGSAKAFLLMPLIVPMAQMFGISPQLSILAFAFGDGFSNVFYPTNPVLLIGLGLADVKYGDWARWTWKLQAANLVMTALLLLFGLAVGYC